MDVRGTCTCMWRVRLANQVIAAMYVCGSTRCAFNQSTMRRRGDVPFDEVLQLLLRHAPLGALGDLLLRLAKIVFDNGGNDVHDEEARSHFKQLVLDRTGCVGRHCHTQRPRERLRHRLDDAVERPEHKLTRFSSGNKSYIKTINNSF